ncbi:IS66 family transposase [Clostridium sp. DJ247]|uniref:IS66 family transposase n=1 Tax=Clostridium sp. DJ247 TaxID=2726188 RepID=UPI001623C583|nr:IS66 family transposase [Clostridium sp. DJ247]MBC2581853.1 IS66 family transposase [Clostridium sp. DJ247]
MSEGKIIEIYNQGISQVISVIKELSNEIKTLNSQVETLSKDNKALNERVKSLESQVNKNSNNRSKPPSSDGFKKTKSLRTKSGKKPGGQEGHEGTTLCLNDTPDEIEIHSVEQCIECGASLKDVSTERYIVRQIIDIPDIKVKIVEHRAEVKICPHCKSKNTAIFPEEIKNTIQYGERLKAVAVYLTQYQLIPYKRGAELIEDLFNHHLSEGSMVTFNQSCHDNLETITNKIRNSLTSSTGAVHFDETGMYINKKRQWLHVASNENLTYYECHEKRGKKAIDDITILPNFNGTAVHDGFKTYYKYTKCNHALCNAHILRELNGITELQDQNWAKPMKNLLLDIKKEVDLTSDKHNALPLDKIKEFELKYNEILKAGFDEDYAKNTELYSNKKVKKSVSLNLLNRLSGYKEQILAFMYDFDIPFDNNLAERDLRMAKVKQKISGTFRSSTGANAFTRIRGYVSTVRKQGKNALECIKSTFTVNPFDPTLT